MSLLSRISIGTRLALAFGAVVALMVSMSVITHLGLSQIDEEVRLTNEDRYPKVKMTNDIVSAVNQQARATRNLMIMSTPTDREEQFKLIADMRQQVATIYQKLEPMLNTEEGKARFASLQRERGEYIAALDVFLGLARAGTTDKAREQLLGTLRQQQREYMKALDDFLAFMETQMGDAAVHAKDSILLISRVLMAVTLIGALIAALCAWCVTRSVTHPLQNSLAALDRVADGDLTVHIATDRSDELGALERALARMVQSLTRVIGNVQGNAHSVSTASTQIAQGNADLSQRTEEQASALEQTTATMEQLAATVRQNADNARQADQLAQGASTVAVRGGSVVGEVVQTMKGISESSQRIAEIIGVIDGIAFQTNILALNAAVEAARAGEHGRGFAVVAGEVRALAQRSADAAKEIKGLIGASVDRVQQGTALVDQAGVTIGEVVTSIKRVSDIVSEISAASAEQSTGIQQIGEAVGQMDRVTQQNAALVEESAAAAESLKGQAHELLQAVAVFKIVDGAQAPAATPAPVAPVAAATSAAGSRGERRGPGRATNVTRPKFGAATVPQAVPLPAATQAATGTDDWASF